MKADRWKGTRVRLRKAMSIQCTPHRDIAMFTCEQAPRVPFCTAAQGQTRYAPGMGRVWSMAIDRNDNDERQARLDAMIEEFRAARQRVIVKRGIGAEAAQQATECVLPLPADKPLAD